MNVLVVAAHPDDEVLGCGATMARLHDEGHHVHVSILGEGETSRHEDPRSADPRGLEELQTGVQAAARVLGAKVIPTKPLPDNRFDTVPLLEIAKTIERLIADVKPTLVLTHHEGDLNVDHALTARAVATATRPQPGSLVQEVLAFEVPSSTDYSFGRQPPFLPDTFFDVARHVDRKIEALRCYAGEMREPPHPRSYDNVRNLARVRGAQVGRPFAEAFQVIRSVR